MLLANIWLRSYQIFIKFYTLIVLNMSSRRWPNGNTDLMLIPLPPTACLQHVKPEMPNLLQTRKIKKKVSRKVTCDYN